MWRLCGELTRCSPIRAAGPLAQLLTQTAGAQARGFSADPRQDAETVDFGFKDVPRQQKASLVAEVFSNVASSYDIMNDLMSGGLHRAWKDTLVETLRPFPGMQHLDVAGGTGDVAFRVLRAIRLAEAAQESASSSPARPQGSSSPPSPPTAAATALGGPRPGLPGAAEAAEGGGIATTLAAEATASAAGTGSGFASGSGAATASAAGSMPTPAARPRGRVVVCDINAEMLEEGRKKAAAQPDLAADPDGLAFELGNAEALTQFADNSFDAYTIAFGIRNVTDRPAALREAYRVLKPGGRFLCLEFSQVSQPLLRQLYDAYSFTVIPRVGGLVAGDAASYQYLVESIRQFPDQETWAGMIEDAGFQEVGYDNILGGVVAMHSGFKLPN